MNNCEYYSWLHTEIFQIDDEVKQRMEEFYYLEHGYINNLFSGYHGDTIGCLKRQKDEKEMTYKCVQFRQIDLHTEVTIQYRNYHLNG